MPMESGTFIEHRSESVLNCSPATRGTPHGRRRIKRQRIGRTRPVEEHSGMKIKKTIDRIPGGLMLVPLLLGACLHTFAPHSGKFLGSFTNALITGTLPILAVWFFCMGASISLKATPVVLRKSGVLVVTKVATAAIAGVIAFALPAARRHHLGLSDRALRADGDLRDERDQRRSLHGADAAVRHEGRSRRVLSDVARVRASSRRSPRSALQGSRAFVCDRRKRAADSDPASRSAIWISNCAVLGCGGAGDGAVLRIRTRQQPRFAVF